MTDMINHPKHYTQASVHLEPIDILRYAPFDLGNCLKYILRAGHKGDALEDWKKARQYVWWAYENYRFNKTHYDDFFKHYGLLLEKFEAFEFLEIHDYTFDDVLEHLEELINDNIRSLSNKNL